MRKAVSIEALVQALTGQRSIMLALASSDLTPYQSNLLALIFNENQNLATLLGLQVPELDQLIKCYKEVAYLEKLYEYEPTNEKASSNNVVSIDQKEEERTPGVDEPEVRSDEAF